MSHSDDLYEQRFGGIHRLYGAESLAKLREAHMVVVGLGGVGSWAAEALARSGVGRLTLIEMDDVCVTNTNRQLHALSSNVGRPKIDVLETRLKDINPDIQLHCHCDFLTLKNIRDYISNQDIVIDAMDSVRVKSALAAYCSCIGFIIFRGMGVVNFESTQCILLNKWFIQNPMARYAWISPP